MISRKKVISKAFNIPYDEIKKYLNIDCFVFTSSMKKDFPEYDFSDDKNDYIDNRTRLRPTALRNIKNVSGWIPTNYHQISETKGKVYNFKEGAYYHIGVLNYDGEFRYQGIHKFENGFKEDTYHIKPFPTHIIPINKPIDPIYYTYE